MVNTCSFCGKDISKETAIIGGNGSVSLCKDCYDLCGECFINEENKIELKDVPTPKMIVDFLDQYIIGQKSAKQKLAIAVYNHYKRLNNKKNDDVELEKSNIVLLGPSGSGKTYLCKTIAKILDVPFVIADATSLTQSGYVGEDVESVLSKLLQASGYDTEKAEKGIVFIDEIDKIGTKQGSTNITRDVSGEGVQQALLKMLEGTIVMCPKNGGRIHPEQKLIPINTENILFICSGAFVGIEEHISRRYNEYVVGYNNSRSIRSNDDPLKNVTAQDLRAFGLIPEFIGRLPVIAHTTELNEDELLRVLIEPKNALVNQYKFLLSLDNVDLEFEQDALKFIVNKSIELKLGARGLRGIMEQIMEEHMFNAPDLENDKITITEEYVKKILA